jgi:elongation factor 1-gamma
MKNLEPWALSVFSLKEYMTVHGKVQLCAKALKPVVKEAPKEPKKKAEPVAAKPKEEKEEKKLDNVQSLPPTNFDLFNFKTFFVNHADKGGVAVDEWYKQLDWEGWAFWKIRYDILEGEGAKEFMINNLLGGFLSRAEHTSKYTFGKLVVCGDEPQLQIQGMWLMRGLELPDGLTKEHSQFEYYIPTKLDPRNKPEDDKLIREYMNAVVDSKVEGMTVRTMRW